MNTKFEKIEPNTAKVREKVEKKIMEHEQITMGEIWQGKFTKEEQYYVCAKLHENIDCFREAVGHEVCPSCLKHGVETSIE